jgi:CheY-like chemotaxis protein
LGNADLARSRIAPHDGAQRFLGQIEAAARRASDLCKQMLAYAGKGTFVLEPICLNALIEETANLLQVSISKKTQLRLDLEPLLGAITADATQLRQVMMNLVINASEAIEPHSGTISIRTGIALHPAEVMRGALLAPESAASTGYAFLEVQDTGHGMSAETQARIFEPFFSTKFAGRGLGLAAVLGIVRSHHGVLKVESAEGRGSVFTLLLPLAERVANGQPERGAQSPEMSDHGTILVVDDEEFVRRAVSQLLEDFGFRSLVAHDGEHAIQVAEQHGASISAVLMDLTMPGIDGEETVRALRDRGVQAPVVLMSGYGEQEAVARFHGSGLASFLQKPFGGEELKAKLARLFA